MHISGFLQNGAFYVRTNQPAVSRSFVRAFCSNDVAMSDDNIRNRQNDERLYFITSSRSFYCVTDNFTNSQLPKLEVFEIQILQRRNQCNRAHFDI